jgi:DNA-binding ferritin-like protein (Dps family)
MPLSGTFDADFSDFVAECAKADAGLAAIAEGATKTEAAVVQMATSAESTATSTGTAITGLSTATTNTSSGFKTMADSLRVADKSLGAMGVSMYKGINVLEELGQVSGKSASELGKLGTAGAVMAAAMAGWNLGRWIADLTGADTAVANLASRLMGWGDVAKETAGATTDLLERASRNAGRTITDVAEAVRINTDAVRANAEQFNTSANRVKAWEAEISKAANSGDLPQIVEDLKTQNSTLEQLTAHYKISTEALQYLQREIRATAEATREKEQADKKAAAEAQAHADAMKRLQDSMFGTDTIAKANQYVTALGGIENLTKMSTAAQTSMNAVLGDAIAAYGRIGTVAPPAIREIYNATLPLPPIVTGLGAEWDNVGVKVTANADSIIGDLKRMEAQTKAYEAETQRMADEWNRVKPPIDAAKKGIDDTSEATKQLTVHLEQAGNAAAMTASQLLAASQQMMDAYRMGTQWTGSQLATSGYWQSVRQQASGDQSRAGAGQQWGTGVGATLTVNVNSTEAGKIAEALTREMRQSGVRF